MYPSSGAAKAAVSRRPKRGPKHWIREWLNKARQASRPLIMAFCLVFLPFIRWFGIPSPFAAALLLAFAGKPSPICLLGLGTSLLLRLAWGLEMDLWQFVGCAGLWALLQRCKPRAGIEVAALGGLAMMPRVFAALAAQQPLDILLSCAAVPLCMLFSALLRYGIDAVDLTGAALRGGERFCLLLTALVLISGFGYFYIGSLSLGQAAAITAALLFAWANGPVYGVVGGLMTGLALVLVGQDVHGMLALALCGFLGGLAPVARTRWLAVPAVALADVLSWFFIPFARPPLGVWTAMAGALGYAMAPSRTLDWLKPYLHGVEARDKSMENAFVTQRISHMRDAIESLARALPRWEEETPSAGEDLGTLLCAQCPNRELCWGRSREKTEKMLCAMMERCGKAELAETETLPSLAQEGCLRADRVADKARDAALLRKKREASQRQARYERELTLTHLAALSGTLGDLGVMAAGESFNDLRAAHVMTLALEELNIPARLSYARRVDGHLQAALEAESLIPMQKPLGQLLRYLAQEEELPLAVARSEKGHIELEEIPLYSASVGTASICAEGEKADACGDACRAKRCEGGRLLMMLCDGMGHGAKAHWQSEKTLELLLLLLEAGYTRRQAITAVNGIMLGGQTQERFSTVDLADVDLWTGDVYGEKLGACASWVVRGNHMKKMEGSSLPLGIVREAASTPVQFRLHSGDILVLMSDGVADAFENDTELKKALEDSLYIQPQRMADALLRGALIAGGGVPKDDMSVMVLLLMDRQRYARRDEIGAEN